MRLKFVIEVDQQRFSKTRLDETVRVTIELFLQRFAFDKEQDIVGECFCFEMRYRTSFRGRKIGCVPNHEKIWILQRLERMLVGRNVVKIISHRRTSYDFISHIGWNRHEHIIGDFATVVAD